jgi:N-acetylgalactosamine-N,N'-diacetylbacillosaminyl-diphospho-undecaprenol 4-alpha-N-acetylgalactosaminyltransferase
MKKKKLAIFVNSLGRGGAEKVVFLLMQQLRQDYDIHLLVFDKSVIEFELPPGITIVQIGKFRNPLRAALVFNIFLYAPTVKKYLLANNIPVLMSFLSRTALTAGVVKLLGWKGSLVICERTMTSEYYSNKNLTGRTARFLIKRLYSRASLIITNSKLNRDDLKKTFGLKNKIITIYNPVDIREAVIAKQAPQDILPNNGHFVFCNVGRCDYYKNQQLLLHAFAKMDNTNCSLMVIGKDVPLKLAPLCKKLQIENKVQLLDLRLDIYPYLQSANAFVLSSVTEGFPNVLLEALACSLPVVSTDCRSGPREILAPGTTYPAVMEAVEEAEFGLLCKNNDADMLAMAMQKMADNPALAKNYAASAPARARCFDVNIFEQEFRDMLTPFYETGKSSAAD